MGQGTESCGGYEAHYDPYVEELEQGIWTQRNGAAIHVSEMSEQHLRRTIRLCESKSREALDDFDEDAHDLWESWVQVFERELTKRKTKPVTPALVKAKKPTRGTKVEVTCVCGNKFQARVADRKRGWGRFCSKSCKAKY